MMLHLLHRCALLAVAAVNLNNSESSLQIEHALCIMQKLPLSPLSTVTFAFRQSHIFCRLLVLQFASTFVQTRPVTGESWSGHDI